MNLRTTEPITRVVAKGLASNGTTVNAVVQDCAGTELFYLANQDAVTNTTTIRGQDPFRQLGEPEEIAIVIGFLCSNDSPWVNE